MNATLLRRACYAYRPCLRVWLRTGDFGALMGMADNAAEIVILGGRVPCVRLDTRRT